MRGGARVGEPGASMLRLEPSLRRLRLLMVRFALASSNALSGIAASALRSVGETNTSVGMSENCCVAGLRTTHAGAA
jgi:hypothetical protein